MTKTFNPETKQLSTGFQVNFTLSASGINVKTKLCLDPAFPKSDI